MKKRKQTNWFTRALASAHTHTKAIANKYQNNKIIDFVASLRFDCHHFAPFSKTEPDEKKRWMHGWMISLCDHSVRACVRTLELKKKNEIHL